MTRILAATSALALLGACALPPEGTDADDLAAFDAAVASVGCELISESDYLAAELQTGLTREQLMQIAQYRIANEEAARLENGGVRLVSGPCAP